MTAVNNSDCKFILNFRIRALSLLFAILGVSSLHVSLAFAQSQNVAGQQEAPQYVSFLDMLPMALGNDDGIKAAKLNYEAAVESEQASRSGLYPKADVTVNHAEQDDSKPGSANDQYSPRELKLKITQPLWDFGETASAIKTAKLSSEQAKLAIGAATNAAILQAAQSYTGLKRAHAQYKDIIAG